MWFDEKNEAGKSTSGSVFFSSKHNINFENVLSFYGQKRTTDQEGVTIPSQRYLDFSFSFDFCC